MNQHVLDAHQALLPRFCVARGCENEADPASSFCGSCRDQVARGERLLYPLAAASAPSQRRRPRVTRRQLAEARTYLTKREVEVLSAASEGLIDAEIGTALSIALETVKSHKRRILAALEAKNTAHAFAIAYRRGLIQ